MNAENFIRQVAPGQVFYFVSDRIDSVRPHYFVLIAIGAGGELHLCCCTSKGKGHLASIERRRLPAETLVLIQPEKGHNPFIKDTYINCNIDPVAYTLQEFKALYKQGQLKARGVLSQTVFGRIAAGLKASPLLDTPFREML